MFNPFEHLINNAVYRAKQEIKEELEEAIKKAAEQVCIDMVAELFTSDAETKRVSCGWSVHGLEVDTVIGKLRKGIAAKVARDFSKKQNDIAIDYITGEQFIDTIIDRIRKKQLSITER